MRRTAPEGLLMDCEMVAINNSQGSGVAINLGPTFLAQKYYQQSPAEVGYKGSGMARCSRLQRILIRLQVAISSSSPAKLFLINQFPKLGVLLTCHIGTLLCQMPM